MIPFTDPSLDALARHVAHGMAVAEATVWTGLYHRALMLPYWTRRKRREIEDGHDRDGGIDVPVPFALNQPSAPLRAAPGPRTEWLVFQFQALAEGGARYDADAIRRAWRALAKSDPPPRLSISQRAAVRALESGGGPPQSGHDQPHYFDDAAVVRAIATAVVLGRHPEDLRAAVLTDASMTNADDGVWAAVAVATAVSELLAGVGMRDAIGAAITELPGDTWIAEHVARALRLALSTPDPLDLAFALDQQLANAAYSYGDAAPDVLAVAFAILHSLHQRPELALWAASCVPRHSASVVPLIGALVAVAYRPADGTRPVWPTPAARSRVPALLGVALPGLAGVRFQRTTTPQHLE